MTARVPRRGRGHSSARRRRRPRETAQERAEIDRLLARRARRKAISIAQRATTRLGARLQALVPARAGLPGSVMPMPGGQLASVGTQFEGHFTRWLQASQRQVSADGGNAPGLDVPYAALYAATLTSDPASGGDLVVPDYRPGIFPMLYRPLVVADLFAIGTTDSNLVTYMVETTYVNAADTVAEGARETRIDAHLRRGERSGQKNRALAAGHRRDARRRAAIALLHRHALATRRAADRGRPAAERHDDGAGHRGHPQSHGARGGCREGHGLGRGRHRETDRRDSERDRRSRPTAS